MKIRLQNLALLMAVMLTVVLAGGDRAEASATSTAHFTIEVAYCGGTFVYLPYNDERDMVVDLTGIIRRMASGVSGYDSALVINTDKETTDTPHGFLQFAKPRSVPCLSTDPNGTPITYSYDYSYDWGGNFGTAVIYCGGGSTSRVFIPRALALGYYVDDIERQYLGYSGARYVQFLDEIESSPGTWETVVQAAGNC